MTTNDSTQNTTDTSHGGGSSPQAHGAASTSQGDTSSTTTTRTVEELERLNAELLRDNASYRKKAKEQEAASQAAEQARLAEQGQFKELASKHEKRVQELEPISERYNTLAQQLAQQIEAEIKDWPPEVKAFDPGADAPIEQRMGWLQKSRPLLEKLQQQARSTLPGNRPNPVPANAAESRQRLIEANTQAWKQRHSKPF